MLELSGLRVHPKYCGRQRTLDYVQVDRWIVSSLLCIYRLYIYQGWPFSCLFAEKGSRSTFTSVHGCVALYCRFLLCESEVQWHRRRLSPS